MEIFEILLIIISAIIGFIIGSVKAFREAKQNAYKEILPPIIKMAYDPLEGIDNKEFNKSLALSWVYANKKVARKMDKVASIINNRSRGDVTKALQNVIYEMRKDIQLLSSQWLNPEEFRHLYTKVKLIKKEN